MFVLFMCLQNFYYLQSAVESSTQDSISEHHIFEVVFLSIYECQNDV